MATPKVVGHPAPLPEERLDTSYTLTGQCSGVDIVEWQGVPSVQAIRVIDNTCNVMVDRFYPFVREMGYSASRRVAPSYSLSLLSTSTSYRSLNDNYYRFRNRPLFCNKEGGRCRPGEQPLPLIGWTDRDIRAIFLMNSTEASNFQALLAHELFHVLSFESGVFEKHHSPIIEENLARRFTIQLGYGDI